MPGKLRAKNSSTLVIVVGAGLLLAACTGAGAPAPTAAPTSPTAVRIVSPPASPTQSVETTVGTASTEGATPAVTSAPAPSIPDPAGYTWSQVAGGLQQPLDLQHAGDGSGRLFVVEQGGVIKIIQSGQVLSTPYLDIRDRVGSQASEQGLLGLAFHPQYAENGHFYVNYTDRAGDTVIARFTVSGDANVADPGSERRLLNVAQPYRNHNGGGMAFGPDGMLYMGLGDGGSGGDPQGNGQSLDTLLGKLLRVDVDGGEPYAIPRDNPFVGGGGLPEIWAYGLRNPWRFSFDRLTGDLYIGDVGQNQWEEIDFLPSGAEGGANFGWNYFEGSHAFEGSPPQSLALIPPAAEYGHGGGRCSVTGGVVYRGEALPAWEGVYLYGDYCSGEVWGLVQNPGGSWTNELLFTVDARISSFGMDAAGEVYLVDLGGNVLRLTAR